MPATEARAVPGDGPPSRIADALFPSARIHYVDGFEAIARSLDGFDDQRPSTCGAYAARYLLAARGHPQHDGIDTAREDYLAWLAGTVLEAEEVAPAEEAATQARELGLSDADALGRFPRTFYAWPLRSSADPAVAGTSPAGVARAIHLASDGALVTLPLPARATGGEILMTGERMAALHDLLAERVARWRVHPIVNYQSDQLLDPTAPEYAPAGLTGGDPAAEIPRDSWGVGHFAGIGALWTAADGRRWALLLDTYKDRGWSGYEPQPMELLRRGLVRSDGREGGVMLVMPRTSLDAARGAVEALGLEVRMWGNGSPEPDDWRWEFGC